MLGKSPHQQPKPDAWLYIDEVSHRALNDYTAMLATIYRASRVVTDAASREALQQVALRLRAGATAHGALRPPIRDTQKRLDADLERLCTALSQSFLAQNGIHLTLHCEPVFMDAWRCWRICLVVSELIRNAARHAFGEERDGDVNVEVRLVAGSLQCIVSDNGCGPELIEPGRGSAVIDGLAADLNGVVLRRFSNQGSTIVLVLPVEADHAALNGRRNSNTIGE